MSKSRSPKVGVRVVTRFRPFNKQEATSKSKGKNVQPMTVRGDKGSVICPLANGRPLKFHFDQVLENDSTQDEAFEKIALPTIRDVKEGFNGTLFAYGQTGSGKTFTMLGPENATDPELMGLIPRSIDYILEGLQNDDNLIEFEVKCCFVEVYQEKVHDLLNSDDDIKIKIRMNKKGETILEGVTYHYISGIEDALKYIDEGSRRRTKAATLANESSSRSHACMMIVVSQTKRDGTALKGTLNFADLAGSERVQKTGAKGNTLKEAQAINQSLTALGNVISALSKNNAHIPFRDSVLTQILKDALSGNSKTTVIICATEHPFNRDETISTLRFGQRAKLVKTNANKNTKVISAETRRLIEHFETQIADLKKELEEKSLNTEIIAELEQTKANLAASEDEVAELTSANADLGTQLLHMQEAYNDKMSEVSDLNRQLQEVDDIREKLLEETFKLRLMQKEKSENFNLPSTRTQEDIEDSLHSTIVRTSSDIMPRFFGNPQGSLDTRKSETFTSVSDTDNSNLGVVATPRLMKSMLAEIQQMIDEEEENNQELVRMVSNTIKMQSCFHGLEGFLTSNNRYVCNSCGAQQKRGAQMFGCRICNHDLCAKCHDMSDVNMTKDMNMMKQHFREWNQMKAEVIKLKDLVQSKNSIVKDMQNKIEILTETNQNLQRKKDAKRKQSKALVSRQSEYLRSRRATYTKKKKAPKLSKMQTKKVPQKIWRQQLEVRFRQIDKNGDGVIDFQEFRDGINLILGTSKKRNLSDRDVVQLFNMFDRKKRKLISQYDFENVFATFSKKQMGAMKQ